MKTIQSKQSVSHLATLTAVLVTGSALLPSLASANTASNTTVRNTVTVNYADASSVAQPSITDEVDVVVQLVAATPTTNSPADQTIAPSSTATYNYTVFSNANGPDTYNITTPVGAQVNLAGSTASPSTGSVVLGATTVAVAPGAIAANTPTAITVPSDATANTNLNQIVLNDVVIIGGVRCDVTAITDSGTAGTGAITNSSVTVDCDAGINPAVGTVIGEQLTFSVTVDPNGFVAPGPGTVLVTATVQDSGAAAGAATDATTTTVEQLLNVVKYVRNVTTGAAGVAPTVAVAGNTYYASGVVGVPGDTLEYLVEVTNTSAGNNATDTVISDPIPAFTTFNATNFDVLDNAGNTVGPSTATANNGDQGEVVGNTVYLYPGDSAGNIGDDTDGGTGNSNGDGGTIGAGLKAYGRFQVDID